MGCSTNLHCGRFHQRQRDQANLTSLFAKTSRGPYGLVAAAADTSNPGNELPRLLI
jgi:hypothetical protein